MFRSAGCIIYEMINLQPAFTNVQEIREKPIGRLNASTNLQPILEL